MGLGGLKLVSPQTTVASSYSNQLQQIISGHSPWVYSVVISSDGQTLASSSHDETIKVWNLGTGKLIYNIKGHNEPVESIAISPDRKLLASGCWATSVKL